MSSQTQHSLTAIYLEGDTVLQVNQDYRVMESGLRLTIPPCEQGDFLCIGPFMNAGSAVKLVRADSVTLDGSALDSNLTTGGVSILRATGTNTWVKI